MILIAPSFIDSDKTYSTTWGGMMIILVRTKIMQDDQVVKKCAMMAIRVG